ncbi:MAG TPA: hypothetical protein VGJ52_11505, partial [Vicinamibacterales bacterium]
MRQQNLAFEPLADALGDANPHPTSKSGHPSGCHGPTRPTNAPLARSIAANMPNPRSCQWPTMPHSA